MNDTVEYESGKMGHLDMRLGGNLSIEVNAYGGSHCHRCIEDMAALATRLGVDVWCNLNGVRTLCRPGDPPAETIAAWDRAIPKAWNAPFPPYASA